MYKGESGEVIDKEIINKNKDILKATHVIMGNDNPK